MSLDAVLDETKKRVKIIVPQGALVERTRYDKLYVERKADDSIFVYIPIPDTLTAINLQKTILPFFGDMGNMELTPPQEFHVTLLLADHATDEQVEQMVAAFTPQGTFEMEGHSVGTFAGSPERPIVVFLKPTEALAGLQLSVHDAAVKAGIVPTAYSKPTQWQPHMTLAYDRKGTGLLPLMPVEVFFKRVQTNSARKGYTNITVSP